MKPANKQNLLTFLNDICFKFKPLIETIGICLGILVLVLTFWNTLISKDLLKLNQQQEENKTLPIWDFEVTYTDSIPFLKLRPYTNEIKIQKATSTIADTLVGKFDAEMKLTQPDYLLPISLVLDSITKRLDRNLKADAYVMTFLQDASIPFGLTIEYIQFGKVKTVNGLFALQYRYNKDGLNKTKVEIIGVLFNEYVPNRLLLEKKVFDSTIKLFQTQSNYAKEWYLYFSLYIQT